MTDRERVQSDEAKGPPESDPRIHGEKHPVARMIGIGVFASLIGIAITLWMDWFPENAATSASKIDNLYDVLLICSVPVFVLVMTIAIYSVVRFRAKPGDMGDGAPIHGNTRLEIIWVTIPFIMVTALAIYGWITLDDLEAKQKNEMVVKVTGQQFTWTFEYPSEKVNSPELVLPVNRPVEFKIQSKDVIHSFWVPQFRLKSDAVPGLTTAIRVTPNKAGRYEVVCAELCGLGHSTMRQFVRVLPASEFDSWVSLRAQGGRRWRRRQRRRREGRAERRRAVQLPRLRRLPHAQGGGRHGEGRPGPRQARQGGREREVHRRPRSSIPTPRSRRGTSPTSCPRTSETGSPRRSSTHS